MLTGTWHRMPMDHVQEKVTDLSIVTSGTANMDRGIIHPGVVNIQVLAAKGIQSLEMLGKPDTYVVIRYGGDEHRTKEVEDCEDPVYDDMWVSTAGMARNDMVEITVMEKYNVKDEELGSLTFPADSFAHNVLEASWFELERDGEVCGEICLAARFAPILTSGLGGAGNRSGHGAVSGDGPLEQVAQYFSGPRPWYMRGGFYYDLSKRVYRRVKHLPMLGLGPAVGECVVERVLSRVISVPAAGDAPLVSNLSRLDHVVAGLISTIDMGIDQTKDQMLQSALSLKKKMTGKAPSGGALEDREGGEPAAAAKKSSGIIWSLVEGTVTHVAKPVASYVPIVGGLGVRVLDYIVPPPPAAETASVVESLAPAACVEEKSTSPMARKGGYTSAFDAPSKVNAASAAGY